MRIKKRKRRIEGKLTEDPYYTGYFTLPWEFTERSAALKTTDKQIAEKRLREQITVLERQHEGEEVPSYLWGAPNLEINGLLDEFLAALKSKERGQKHIDGVRVHITRLIGECKWRTVDAISQRSFESWLASNPQTLRTKLPLSAKTKKEYQSDTIAFCKWLVSCQIIRENPLEHLKPITVKGKETKFRAFWTPDILRAFMTSRSDGQVDYRSAVFLLYKTSMRKSSLQNLRWADVHIDIDCPYIELRVSNSKNKERLIRHIDEETRAFLLRMRSADHKPGDPVLSYKIPNSTRLQKDLEAIGIPYRTEIGDLDFHALRHTSATVFTANGANSAAVQKLLGQKTRAMAERYTIYSGVDVQPELAKLPPVYSPDSWTGIWTGLSDFSGHLPSQAVTEETVSENVATPVFETPRHKNAPPVSERHNRNNGGESRIGSLRSALRARAKARPFFARKRATSNQRLVLHPTITT